MRHEPGSSRADTPPGTLAPVDVGALVRELGVDFEAARTSLTSLYTDVDLRNARNTESLDLPCRRGCDACCHESVFVTPLEFLVAWDWAQEHIDDGTRARVAGDGLVLYERLHDLIEACEGPPSPGAEDHLAVARELRFRCPFLDEAGGCRIYPVRELYARLFGCSFNEEGGVYGCERVGAQLGGKVVTMVSVKRAALSLAELPLTGKRQVYPYYLYLLYGAP